MITKKLILVLSLLAGLTAFSQKEPGHKKDDLLFLLRQTEHINQALKTIADLKTSNTSQLRPGKIVIIVCGEAVVSLTGKEAGKWVEQISKYENVSILACGLSLDKFQKKQSDLLDGIGYTKNGLIKAFELQKLGYLSVEL